LTLGRHNYVTPTSYLELLSIFKIVLGQKNRETNRLISRLSNGLDKLKDANAAVASMRKVLVKLQPELAQKTKDCAETMQKIMKDKKIADKKQKVVAVQKKDAQQATEEANILAAEAKDGVKEANKKL
jgi:dynein heavy chain